MWNKERIWLSSVLFNFIKAQYAHILSHTVQAAVWSFIDSLRVHLSHKSQLCHSYYIWYVSYIIAVQKNYLKDVCLKFLSFFCRFSRIISELSLKINVAKTEWKTFFLIIKLAVTYDFPRFCRANFKIRMWTFPNK